MYILFDKFQFWGLLQIVFCIVLSKGLVNDMTRFGKTTPVWQMLKSTVQLGEFERSFCSKLRRKEERKKECNSFSLLTKWSFEFCPWNRAGKFVHSRNLPPLVIVTGHTGWNITQSTRVPSSFLTLVGNCFFY